MWLPLPRPGEREALPGLALIEEEEEEEVEVEEDEDDEDDEEKEKDKEKGRGGEGGEEAEAPPQAVYTTVRAKGMVVAHKMKSSQSLKKCNLQVSYEHRSRYYELLWCASCKCHATPRAMVMSGVIGWRGSSCASYQVYKL